MFSIFKRRDRVWLPYDPAAITSPDLLRAASFDRFQRLPMAIVAGEQSPTRPAIIDLCTAPHILIAGTTGSGKSVAVNSIICQLLVKHGPRLHLFVIDPKRVDYAIYKHLPHVTLGGGYAHDLDGATDLLRRVHAIMLRRFDLMEAAGVRHWDRLPRSETDGHCVVVVDEYASLATLGKMSRPLVQTLEDIARLGRAAGVHLILATQRPTRDVVTGQIKANCPVRLAFRVPSRLDSRVILDAAGAEELRGRGDCIAMMEDGHAYRCQGLYIPDSQISDIIAHYIGQSRR